ncbi:hypothetical protein R80B4_03269 [Fibrobacteres bacterium R8-0-B4]
MIRTKWVLMIVVAIFAYLSFAVYVKPKNRRRNKE